MYGTIMRGRVKAGKRDDFVALFRDLVPSAGDYGQGLHSVELAWEDADPQRVVVLVHFRDRESYLANASRPETDADFQRQRELLDSDPEWIDVEYGDYVGNPLTATATAAAQS